MAIGNPITLTSNVASKTISVIATAGQTLFTVTGGYRINQLAVFRNGVRLLDGRDYEARNGATVTLLSAATVGDALEFQVFDDFRVADAIVSAESEQTIQGNLTVAGILTATNLSVTDLSLRHLEATGISTVSDTTQSTSTTTGALIVSGGVGIAKSLFVGGNVSVGGTLSYEDVTNVDSVGIITARSHVSIADSILHTGDTDTSIRFPSAGTFTVENNGSESLRIDPNGHLMLGQTTAYGATGAGNTVATFTNSGNYRNNLVVSNQTNGTDSGAAVVLAAHGNDWIIEAKGVAKGQRSLAINSGSTEALRVNFDGNVGIGTTIAQKTLHVSGTSDFIVDTDSAALRIGSYGEYDIALATGRNTLSGSSRLYIENGNNEALRITSAGLVGINTASPDRALHVFSTNGTVAHFESGNANEISQIVFEGLGASAPPNLGATGEHLHFTTNNLERVRIISDGKVGIGTTIPGGKLQIDGGELLVGTKTVKAVASTTNATAIFRDDAGNHTIIAVESSAGSGGGTLALSASRRNDDNGFSIVQDGDVLGEVRFAGDDGTNLQHSGVRIRAEVDGTPAEDDMPGALAFLTNPGGTATVERVRVSAAGSFGIGTNDPDKLFHVESSSTTRSKIGTTSASSFGQLYVGDEDKYIIGYRESHANQARELSLKNINASGTITFRAGGDSERMRIDTSGRLLVGRNSAMDTNGHAVIQGYSSAGALLCIGRDDTSVTDGNNIGEIRFLSRGGSSNDNLSAEIQCQSVGSHSNGSTPGSLIFRTTAPSSTSPTGRLVINAVGSFHFKNGAMIENGIVDTTARTGTQAVNLDNGMVHYFTSSSTGTWKPNFRVNSSNTLNSQMSNGDVCSPTMIVNKSNTGHYADSVQVDGSDRTIEWLGGAPTEGGGNNTFDIYSYTIVKTADDTFIVFGSVSTYE